MPIYHHPNPGDILMCDFDTGFAPPEMIKVRMVVIVSPRPRRIEDELCTVIPLSTVCPTDLEEWHHELNPASLPGKFADNKTWAKCDMIYRVAFHRLDRVKIGKDIKGKRIYVSHAVIPQDLKAIQKGIMCGLGLNHLTAHIT